MLNFGSSALTLVATFYWYFLKHTSKEREGKELLHVFNFFKELTRYAPTQTIFMKCEIVSERKVDLFIFDAGWLAVAMPFSLWYIVHDISFIKIMLIGWSKGLVDHDFSFLKFCDRVQFTLQGDGINDH